MRERAIVRAKHPSYAQSLRRSQLLLLFLLLALSQPLSLPLSLSLCLCRSRLSCLSTFSPSWKLSTASLLAPILLSLVLSLSSSLSIPLPLSFSSSLSLSLSLSPRSARSLSIAGRWSIGDLQQFPSVRAATNAVRFLIQRRIVRSNNSPRNSPSPLPRPSALPARRRYLRVRASREFTK